MPSFVLSRSVVWCFVRSEPSHITDVLRCARAAKQQWDAEADAEVEKRWKWHKIQISGAFLSTETIVSLFSPCHYLFICIASVSLYYRDFSLYKSEWNTEGENQLTLNFSFVCKLRNELNKQNKFLPLVLSFSMMSCAFSLASHSSNIGFNVIGVWIGFLFCICAREFCLNYYTCSIFFVTVLFLIE